MMVDDEFRYFLRLLTMKLSGYILTNKGWVIDGDFGDLSLTTIFIEKLGSAVITCNGESTTNFSK